MEKNNFYLYFARFCRHLILTKKWKDILTFLDLTHSFRCLIDIKNDIDSILEEENYLCKFKHIINLKELKKSSLDGITIFNEFSTESGMLSHMGFAKRAVSKEELDQYEYIKPRYQNKTMKFTEWLGCEIAAIKENNNVVTVNREIFIKRIANKFSGSHPFEKEYYNEGNQNLDLIYSNIDRLQGIRFSNYNYGYLLVQLFAEELAIAIIDLLLLDETNVGYNIFKTCKELLRKTDK